MNCQIVLPKGCTFYILVKKCKTVAAVTHMTLGALGA